MENNIGEARRAYALTTESGNYTQEDAARDFGVSLSAYRRWEQGVSKGLKGEHLKAMANRYGVTVDYLIGATKDPNRLPVSRQRPQIAITADEDELLTLYRSLDDIGREMALCAVRGMASSREDTGRVEEKLA